MDSMLPPGRRQRKRQAIHQQITEAAERLFHERGIARTTVDDIAEAADVARQTFFNHFPYKEALAVELTAEGVQEVAHQAQALLEAGTSALDVLRHTAECVLEDAIREGDLAVVVARELLHPDPERAHRAAERIPLKEIFDAILVQAREEGSLRSDLPVEAVAGRLSAAVRSIIAQINLYDAEQVRKELAICIDIVFNGIVDRST